MTLDVPENCSEVVSTREKSRAAETLELETSGTENTFEIERDFEGGNIEAEAPPGRPLRKGDDYYVDGRSLRFYQPPPAGTPGLLVTLPGKRTRGYREKKPCRILLTLKVRSGSRQETDEIFDKSFGAVIGLLHDIGIVRSPDVGGVSMKLIRSAAALQSITRNAETVENKIRHLTSAVILILGDLELTLSRDEAKDGERISEIIITET